MPVCPLNSDVASRITILNNAGVPVKTLLLAGIAALLLAIGAATAQSSKVELPNEILGTWCNDWSAWTTAEVEGEYHYWPANDKDDCANRGGMTISQQGIEFHRFDWSKACKFTTIEFSRTADPAMVPPFRHPKDQENWQDMPLRRGAKLTDVYLVHINCKADEDDEDDEQAFEIEAGEYLTTWDLAES